MRINNCSHCAHKHTEHHARCSNLKFGFLVAVSFVTLQITGIVSPIFALGHVISSRVIFAKKYDTYGNPIPKELQNERIKKIKSDRLTKASLAAFNSIPVLGPAVIALGLICTFTIMKDIGSGLKSFGNLQKKHKKTGFISELGSTIRASTGFGTAIINP